jgi:hypothetical protein
MNHTREPRRCVARRSRVLDYLIPILGAVAAFTTAAEAKVIWDSATPLTLHQRDICRARPLARAEHLARRELFLVQRPSAPFVPYYPYYPFASYRLLVPTPGTGWIWSDGTVPPFTRICDTE